MADLLVTHPIDKRSRKVVARAAYIIWAVAVGWVLLELVGVFSMTTGLLLGNALLGDTARHQPLTVLPQVLQAELAPGATGDATDVVLWLRLLCATPYVLNVVIVILAALMFHRIIDHVGRGQPFSSTVQRAWTRLSGLLVWGGLAQTALSALAVGIIAGGLQEGTNDRHLFGAEYSGLGINGPDVPWMLIVLGIIAGALAIVFREGARLEDEVAGVV